MSWLTNSHISRKVKNLCKIHFMYYRLKVKSYDITNTVCNKIESTEKKIKKNL